jgi:glutamate-1-semialdehyde 2,1-aminomutase
MIQDSPTANQWEIKTFLLQEMLARGVLWLGTHNLSHAHGETDIDALLAVYDAVLALLAEVIRQGDLAQRLICKPLEPLFKVRG